MKDFLYKISRSSSDPKKLSLMIQGLGVLIPSALLLSQFFGVSLTSGDLQAVLDSLNSAVVAGIAVAGAIATLVGAVRKVVNAFRVR